jgi:serine/threonine protein kinase
VAELDWTTLTPFEERSVTGIKYGFTLKAKGERVDFYTNTAEELTTWVDYLEVYCVLTDIDDDYTLIRQIGVGGQAQVYLGESQSSGKRVAIKQYTKFYLMEQAKRLESLVGEIKILRKCSHPHIVQLYQVYEDEHTVSLVMEYIPGEELYKNFVHYGRFHSSEAKLFAANFLDLLEYLDSVHILHRDLKPENIMIPDHTNRADFKLIDFGFAMEYTGQPICDSCGSPGYIAPEVINERRHDASVDLYSAGVILYVALCGHSPFFADNRKEVLRLNAAGVIRCDVHRPEEKLVQLILSMTAFDPLQRGSIPHLRRLLAGCNLVQPIDSLPFSRSQ